MTPKRPKYHQEHIFDPAIAHPDEAHSVLMRLIPPNSRVLELGCASGYLSGYMEQALNCRVTGLEADPAATAIAQTRCSAVYTVDLDSPDALTPAQQDAPYDVLLAAAVLEHLKYPERLLQTVRTLLKPDARIIISLPNIAYWRIRLRLLRGNFDYEDYGVMDRTYLRLYTRKTGAALSTQNGYRIEQFYIAGSGLQNMVNRLAHRFHRPLPAPILPELLAYELIYVARQIG